VRSSAIALAILFVQLVALGQSNTSTLSGVVSETSRAPVAGVSIQLKNTETGAIFRATTGLTGAYTVSQLPTGKYELTATSFGYKDYERKDLVIQAGANKVDIPIGDFISLGTLGEDRNSLGLFFLSRPAPPNGPAPRMPDGKPDFSGLWYGPSPAGLAETPELLPWAAAVEKERKEHNLKDAPSSKCLPFNIGFASAFLNRFVQSKDMLVTVIEYDIPGYRQIYLDGRSHPKDLDPSWTGHSIGKWEGDTLVVETVGFNDKTWLGEAAPHTDQLKVVTRMRRPDLGHIEIEGELSDPGALKKPWITKGTLTLAPSKEEILEFICNENNQDVEHLVGK
jgi:hypothetical protein